MDTTRRRAVLNRVAIAAAAIAAVAYTVVSAFATLASAGVWYAPAVLAWTLLYLAGATLVLALVLWALAVGPLAARWLRHDLIPWITAQDRKE